MSEPHGEAPARAAVRAGAEYLLRSLELLGRLVGGQMLTGLVSLALTQANVAHLMADGRYADLDDLPPDAERRPVSVLALAASLGLPYETTRRHVEALIRAGHCVRVKGGVITPAVALDTELHRELLIANLANLRRLARELRTVGMEF